MAVNQGRGGSGKKSWRSAKPAVSPAARSARRQKRIWTTRSDAEGKQAVRRHRAQVVIWSLVAAGLIGGFIWWVIYMPVRTPLIAATVTVYDEPIPPNAWAKEDAERFGPLADDEIVTYTQIGWDSREQGIDDLCAQYDAAKPGGPGKDVVMLYLSMHGAVNDAGEPCLLPPGASPCDSSQWLPLSELLAKVFSEDRKRKVDAEDHKILILDCDRMDANWSMGLLYNGFADKLDEVVREAGVPNLVVINSTSPGQVGWGAPELRGSVFGYFLWRGLKGAADAEQTGNNDDRVSLRELLAYLKANVGQWVTENRADVQEPMLVAPDLSDEADFGVVHAEWEENIPVPNYAAERDSRWDIVRDRWLQHAELARRTPPPHRVYPLQWEQYQRTLLRLESLLSAGQRYEQEFDETNKELDDLVGVLQKDPTPDGLAAYSLPLAERLSPASTTPEQQQNLTAFFQQDTGQQEMLVGWFFDVPAKGPQPDEQIGYPYLPAAEKAWQWALANASDEAFAGTLPGLLRFVDRPKSKPDADVIEIHFLRMLATYLDPNLWQNAASRKLIADTLDVRRLAEGLAAPGDERVQYWLESLVDASDAKRRAAEDRLFAGTPYDLVDAEDRLKEALGSTAASAAGGGEGYREAQQLAGRFSRALATRDEALAKIAYLAQWQMARLHQRSPEQLRELGLLIENTQVLSRELDKSLEEGIWDRRKLWPPALADAQAAVETNLADLEDAFGRECNQLRVSAGDDKQTLQAIGTVLSVPLVTGRERNALREKYVKIAGQTAAATEAAEAAEAFDPWRYLGDMAAGKEHPAWSMVRGETAENGGGAAGAAQRDIAGEPQPDDPPDVVRNKQRAKLARQGAQVRQALIAMPGDVERSMEQGKTQFGKEGSTEPSLSDWLQSALEVRGGYARADRRVRGAAVLLAGLTGHHPWDNADLDAARQLERVDLHYLMLWQCRRTLDDFWGPRSGRNQASFFQVAAQRYLESARDLCPEDIAVRQGKDYLSQLMQERVQAARLGIEPQAGKMTIADRQQKTIPQQTTLVRTPNLPEGRAAFYLLDADRADLPLAGERRDEEVRRMSIPADKPEKRETLDYLALNNERLRDQRGCEAVVLYRGHVWTDEFWPVLVGGGLDIVWTRAQYVEPKITVRGEALEDTPVVFIFDCSATMAKPLSVEAAGGNPLRKPGGKPPTRIEEAREAMHKILDRLAKPDQPYKVGVMVYGHRAGWASGNSDEIVTRPPGLKIHPNEDVETILKLGRFSKAEEDDVMERLDRLQPLGETPLYLAILEAIDELPVPLEEGQKRHIVVITDGLNDQWPDPNGPADKRKSAIDVEEKLKTAACRDIQLDVVGFDLVPKKDEEKKSLDQLKELARKSGGEFHNAKDQTTIVKALEDSLRLRQYIVQSLPDGSLFRTNKPIELNQSVVIPQGPGQEVPYQITVEDPARPITSRVTLEGGEAPVLTLFDDPRLGWRLVHHRYATGLRDSRADIPDPLNPDHRVYFGAHIPERIDNKVRFDVSVQNQDATQFSPRPAEAWIEIMPVVPRGSDPPPVYAFYDLNFVPRTPVPVLRCEALDWPRMAREADIRVWCKFQRTEPDEELAVDALVRHGELTIPGIPDVKFTVEVKPRQKAGDPYQVIVTQQHAAGSDFHSVKVEMDPANPPDEVIHNYNAQARIVRHKFYYADFGAAEIGRYKVCFTSRRKLLEGAVASGDPPMNVVVPATGITGGQRTTATSRP